MCRTEFLQGQTNFEFRVPNLFDAVCGVVRILSSLIFRKKSISLSGAFNIESPISHLIVERLSNFKL